jgi:cytochrome c-type biogenesis protein
LVSLLSPCTLPMIPVYLASLSGPEILSEGIRIHLMSIFFHSLTFVIGFSLIFVILGGGAGLIGSTISSHLLLVHHIAGGLLILFGLLMIASLKVSWLNYEKRLATPKSVASGYARSFLIGIIFTLAWTPCAGPVLGSILTLAFNSELTWRGSYLLGFYSLGIALPLIVIGLAFDSLSPLLKRISRFSVYWYILSGVFLISIGILIVINKLTWFSF